MSYPDFLEFIALYGEANCVVRTVEAHEPDGEVMYFRADATFHTPHSSDGPVWKNNVAASIEFVAVVLRRVDDKEALLYQVWLDGGEQLNR